MDEYRVTWTIDISADSAYDAAERALAAQRNPESIATVFGVQLRETAPPRYEVDLTEGTIDGVSIDA